MVRSHRGMRRQDGAYFQPRLHVIRHSFALHGLVAWYRQGSDVQLLLPKLSTYLGHIGLAETQRLHPLGTVRTDGQLLTARHDPI